DAGHRRLPRARLRDPRGHGGHDGRRRLLGQTLSQPPVPHHPHGHRPGQYGPGPQLPDSQPLASDGYPGFSPAEMARRRDALTDLLREHGADRALVYGFDRSGSAVEWLTGWPVTREGALLLRPGQRDLLFVCFNNHVPNARRLAPDADVRPGNASALDAALDVLATRADRGATGPAGLGVIGPVPARASDRLAATAGQIVFLDREYTSLRLVKSAEELARMRAGAAMSDDAVAALAAAARPGMTEAECCASLEGAY